MFYLSAKFCLMKSITTIFGLLMSAGLCAQLYVRPNSYVYANDQFIFVKQNVDLASNANLYLRNGSQLLQGVAGASTNAGAGKLSVYQEGTVDNFEYNYWCSPVGNASAVAGNENFGITMLNRPLDALTSVPATILTGGFDGIASSLSIARRWIYKFTTSNSYSQWIPVTGSNIAAGEGFTMKGTAGTDPTTVLGIQNNPGGSQRYDFRGKPNDGDIPITVGAGQWTLTGNPYPSAINLNQFLLSSPVITGIAYFWEQDKSVNSHQLTDYSGGYASYAPVNATSAGMYIPAVYTNYNSNGDVIPGPPITGNTYQRFFSPVGQGFMIAGASNGTVFMRNEYRVFRKEGAALNSQFERSASQENLQASTENLPDIPNVAGFDYTTVTLAPVPQIRFSAKVGTGIRTLALGFDPAATDGADHGMDAKSGDANPIDVFFAISNKEYMISVIDFDIDKTIPLGLRNAAPATFQITMSEMINFNGAQHVYVHDKLNDSYFEITDAVYEVAMPAGTNTDRFELTFRQNALGLPTLSTDSFAIVQDNPKQQLMIANPNHFDVKNVSVFDLTGKLVISKDKLGSSNQYQFSTDALSESVYIVKITTADNRDIAQKISVFKTNN